MQSVTGRSGDQFDLIKLLVVNPIASHPHLILMIGLPGSGKSTLASQLADRSGYLLVSTDAIREQLFGNEAVQGSWELIWREVQRVFQQAIEPQSDTITVIYDATNVVRRDRRKFLAWARSIGFRHITGLWIDTPLEVCLERNRLRDRQVPSVVIYRMNRRLVGAPPSLAEGLDSLIRYPALSPFGSRFLCENRDSQQTEIAIDLIATTEPDCPTALIAYG